MSVKSKVPVVGGTGYIGKRIVRANLAQGHTTFVLQRREIGLDIDKLQMLLSFKEQGAHLIEGSFSDHQSLVDAVKPSDGVIRTMYGVHFRSHNSMLQLKLVDAIKDAGNFKQCMTSKRSFSVNPTSPDLSTWFLNKRRNVDFSRFLLSEFGIDPARMENALEPGRVTFDEKMTVRKAIEDAGIPFTYISANRFACYFVGNLSQMGILLPPRDKVCLYGDGNMKGIIYLGQFFCICKSPVNIFPPQLYKTVYIRPSENILSQRELVGLWEKHIGKELQKSSISAEDFLAALKSMEFAAQAGAGHFYHIIFEGCLTKFEVREEEETSMLYPEVAYTRIDEYLKRYL